MKKILILIGGNLHPYEEFVNIIKETSKMCDLSIIEEEKVIENGEIFNFDGILIYTEPQKFTKLNKNAEENLIKYLKNGGGLFILHSSIICFKENQKLQEILGCKFLSHSPVFEYELKSNNSHFINRRIPSTLIQDEFYFLDITSDNIQILFEGYWQGKILPLGYIKNYENGRIFYFSPGHSLETFKNKDILKVIKRGINWIIKNEKQEREIKCGIIGYGPAFGMGKYHAELINSTYGLKTVAFYDINKERVEQAKKDFPESR
ncbi:MAG: ThuA domain-containing protein, partial [Candidatus Omnitrophica bacterium]|nr:ThuA domain-containing protein [Candidatus Omnitrophota bacterium]